MFLWQRYAAEDDRKYIYMIGYLDVWGLTAAKSIEIC